MNNYRFFIVVTIFLSLTGCYATTAVTSYTDPDYRNTTKFQNVMVFGTGMNLELRQLCESETVNELTKNNAKGIRSIDYIPPTRELSDDEINEILIKTKVDSLLFITLIDTSIDSTYVPQTYHEGNSYSTVNVIGNYAYVNTYSSPGYTTGGYNIEEARATYESTLHDVKNNRTAWKADGDSQGDLGVNFKDLTVSASKETVLKLIEDGLL